MFEDIPFFDDEEDWNEWAFLMGPHWDAADPQVLAAAAAAEEFWRKKFAEEIAAESGVPVEEVILPELSMPPQPFTDKAGPSVAAKTKTAYYSARFKFEWKVPEDTTVERGYSMANAMESLLKPKINEFLQKLSTGEELSTIEVYVSCDVR